MLAVAGGMSCQTRALLPAGVGSSAEEQWRSSGLQEVGAQDGIRGEELLRAATSHK